MASEAEKRFEDNIALVYYVAGKLENRYISDPNIHDDVIQEGFIALWKACQSFDISRGVAFSTYACKAIQNHMMCYAVRYNKRQARIQYLEDSVDTEIDSGTVTYEDVLEDPSASFADIDIYNQIITAAEQIGDKAKIIVLKIIEGHTQDEIAKMVGLSQPTVSRIIRKIREKIKDE